MRGLGAGGTVCLASSSLCPGFWPFQALRFCVCRKAAGEDPIFRDTLLGSTQTLSCIYSVHPFQTYTSTGALLGLRALSSCGLRGCFQLLFYRQTISEPYLEAAHLTGVKVKHLFFLSAPISVEVTGLAFVSVLRGARCVLGIKETPSLPSSGTRII